MKDIVITARHLRREAWIFVGCLGVGCLVNAGAIVAYERPWAELYTQIGYVVVMATAIYVLLALVRGLILLLSKLFHL